ncbi:unnamed protein product [Allacma fusca]|uniref:Uncharacterized protein n=1 Tax=Allacma fusca TaxID=39272 RepID=A0A8J2LR54_9HEXA|nr:unnamed protein product [Allacma fusca]
MSHRFSNLSGRLVKSIQGVGQNLKPAKESTDIVYGPGFKVAKVSNEFIKPGSAPRLDKTLLSNYRKFQQPSEVPVHLKGGPADRLLFGTTILLCGLGLEECFRFYYNSAFPASKE